MPEKSRKKYQAFIDWRTNRNENPSLKMSSSHILENYPKSTNRYLYGQIILWHGGWRSTSVTEEYIDNSLKNKMNTANKLTHSIQCASTSSATQEFFGDTVQEETTDMMSKQKHRSTYMSSTVKEKPSNKFYKLFQFFRVMVITDYITHSDELHTRHSARV